MRRFSAVALQLLPLPSLFLAFAAELFRYVPPARSTSPFPHPPDEQGYASSGSGVAPLGTSAGEERLSSTTAGSSGRSATVSPAS